MRVDITSRTDVFEARLSDKMLFADNTAFRKLMDEVRQAGCKTCVFDLKNLEVIDSAGLGMLMIAIEDAKRSGRNLFVKNPQGPVLKLLQLSRMDQLLKVA